MEGSIEVRGTGVKGACACVLIILTIASSSKFERSGFAPWPMA